MNPLPIYVLDVRCYTVQEVLVRGCNLFVEQFEPVLCDVPLIDQLHQNCLHLRRADQVVGGQATPKELHKTQGRVVVRDGRGLMARIGIDLAGVAGCPAGLPTPLPCRSPNPRRIAGFRSPSDWVVPAANQVITVCAPKPIIGGAGILLAGKVSPDMSGVPKEAITPIALNLSVDFCRFGRQGRAVVFLHVAPLKVQQLHNIRHLFGQHILLMLVCDMLPPFVWKEMGTASFDFAIGGPACVMPIICNGSLTSVASFPSELAAAALMVQESESGDSPKCSRWRLF